MPTYTAVLKNTVVDGIREVVLVPSGATAPAAHTSIGTLVHVPGDQDTLFHHVRDLLYPLGIYDMMNVLIKLDDEVLILDFDLSKNVVALVGTANTTVDVWVRPAQANFGTVTVVSSDTGKATVAINASTKVITITGVAAGTSTITVATNGVSKTIAVTVT